MRFGSWDRRGALREPDAQRQPIDSASALGFGDVVDDHRRQRLFGRPAAACSTSARPTSDSRSARQGFYGQTTYQLLPDLSVAGGGNFEREQGFPSADIDGDPTTTRNNSAVWVEGRGTLLHRVSVTAGLGYAHNEGFDNAYSPRLSVAAYLRSRRRTSSGATRG